MLCFKYVEVRKTDNDMLSSQTYRSIKLFNTSSLLSALLLKQRDNFTFYLTRKSVINFV
jgi:hypothetical protein